MVIKMKNEKLVIKSKRPKGNDGYKTFSIRIKEDIVNDIDKISLKTGRSRNELVGLLLQYAIANCELDTNK